MTIAQFKGIAKVIIWNYVLKSVYLINKRESTYFTGFFLMNLLLSVSMVVMHYCNLMSYFIILKRFLLGHYENRGVLIV